MHVTTAASSGWTSTRSTSAGGRRQPGPATSRRRTCSRRVSARPTASTTTRCSAPATAGRSTRCRGRGRCAASTRCRSATAAPAPNGFVPTARWPRAFPGAEPDVASGSVPLPRGVDMRTPEVGNVERGTIDSWNVFVERRLPGDLSLSVGYVGTATNNGYARHQPELRRERRQRQPAVLRAGGQRQHLLWASRTKARYHSLQMALNRPFKNGLLLKGAYTFSQGAERGRRRRLGTARAGISRRRSTATTRAPATTVRTCSSWASSTSCPGCASRRASCAQLVKNWQINGIGSLLSGTPFTVGGDNGLADQQAPASRRPT